jgi:hypothetical protein
MCYAVANGERTHYVSAATNGFFHSAAEPAWPAGGPLAEGLNRVLREADPARRVWRRDPVTKWNAAFPNAQIGAVLRGADAVVVYLTRAEASSLKWAEANGASVYSLIPFGTPDSTARSLTNVAVVMK